MMPEVEVCCVEDCSFVGQVTQTVASYWAADTGKV